MAVSGTSCSDGLDPTKPQSSISAGVFYAENGKTVGDIISEKYPIEAVVETGSAHAGPEKSPTAEPSVAIDAGSLAIPTASQPTFFSCFRFSSYYWCACR